METNIFKGELVRLSTEEPEVGAKAFSRWGRNSEYGRMLDSNPYFLWSAKKIQEWIEKDMEKEPVSEYFFFIRTLEEDKLIGFVSLGGTSWNHGDTWVGIGLGESDYWGKGYGTDAMRLVLRYAFIELNLNRVNLSVFEYNPRGIKSYEKAGFKHEGRIRSFLLREGRRWDLLIMGVLREEWLAQHPEFAAT